MSKRVLTCSNCDYNAVRTAAMGNDTVICPECWIGLTEHIVSSEEKPAYWNDAIDPCWYCGEDHFFNEVCQESKLRGAVENG